ncbi:hypothetical protein, partial [Providencia rettgeri]|uniref:hypothetical protein n=1 Tax=Providencia rettgeri TaxID=587 RepID=UPI001BD0168D
KSKKHNENYKSTLQQSAAAVRRTYSPIKLEGEILLKVAPVPERKVVKFSLELIKFIEVMIITSCNFLSFMTKFGMAIANNYLCK